MRSPILNLLVKEVAGGDPLHLRLDHPFLRTRICGGHLWADVTKSPKAVTGRCQIEIIKTKKRCIARCRYNFIDLLVGGGLRRWGNLEVTDYSFSSPYIGYRFYESWLTSKRTGRTRTCENRTRPHYLNKRGNNQTSSISFSPQKVYHSNITSWSTE